MNKQDLIESALTNIFGFLNIDPEVVINETEANVYDITIKGDNLNYLIGYQGQSLDALRTFLSLMLFKRTNEPSTLTIDINGYKDRKNEKLQFLTKNLIDKVRFFEKDVEMPPMTPWERRQVHMIVSEYDDILSESTGEGRDRHVVLKSKRHKAD